MGKASSFIFVRMRYGQEPQWDFKIRPLAYGAGVLAAEVVGQLAAECCLWSVTQLVCT